MSKFKFRGTLTGLIVGTTGMIFALAFLNLYGERVWLIQLVKGSAWLGFQVLGSLFEGHQLKVSLAMDNALLVLLGAVQWGLVGSIYDLARHAFRKKVTRP